MGARFVGRTAVAAVAAATLAGCYTYRPATLDEIRPESRVRVTVSTERAVALEPVLRDVRRQLVATYVGEDDGSLLLEVPLIGATAGTSTRAVHNRVDVPRADIVAVEARELSLWRTATVAGVLAALVGYGGYEVFNSGDDEEGKPKPPDVEQIRVPLISVPLGW